MTTPTTQCIKLSKKIRLKHQYDKLISIKPLAERYNFMFSTLPIVLILLLLHIIYHVILNASRLFSIAVELPLTSKDRSFGNAARLGVLNQWLEILYPGQHQQLNVEVDNGISELLEGRCNASRAGILASYMDSIDYVVRDLGLYLPDE